MPDCPSCHAVLPAESRFCNICGTPLAIAGGGTPRAGYTPRHLVDKVLSNRSALEGERKQVTVLFADMVGSTRLAETVDPEQWHGILDEFFNVLGDEIHRYEGTINQYTGDGIMALFGAPVAHEDHAQRACYAALALQRRLREFADRLRLERGLNLSVRMGLNSGEVVVGRIGDDLRMDYTAQGLTVNLAARMESIAAPGQVFLTRHTAALVEGYFELRDLGAMQVKGAPEPVPVYELVAATRQALRLEVARQRGLTTFIGRRRESELLDQLLQQARAGEGRVAVLIGDGGIGKSRLCFEAIERWRAMGLRVMHASAVPYSRSVPLLPIRELLKQRFGVTIDDNPEAARGKVAGVLLMMDGGLRDQLPLVFDFLDIADPQAPGPEVPPDARAHRILELFARVCPTDRTEATVVVVEDLHWIDNGSESFLSVMVEAAACAPLLVLFNTRPGPLPDWLAKVEPEQIPIQPLGAEAMGELTSTLLGAGAELGALASRIAEMAAGNPFFVEETVRALVAQDVLKGQPGAYQLAVGAKQQIEIPASVQALVAGRIDRLEADAKDLLQIAAVLGKTFRLDTLRGLAALDQARFERSLDELKAGRYIQLEQPKPPQDYGFCHPLLQEVAYSAILSDRRRELHARVGQVLEGLAEQAPGAGEISLLLAHHWYEAGQALPAARWGLAASQWVAARDIHVQHKLVRQIIDILGPHPPEPEGLRMAIAARSALIRVATFYPVPAAELEAAYTQAQAMAQQSNNRLALAELYISHGSHWLRMSRADLAAEETRRAMNLAQEIGDPSLESRFRIPILFSHFALGRLQEVLTLLDRRDGGAWHRGAIREDSFLSRGFRALMVACLGQVTEGIAENEAAIAYAQAHKRSVSWMYSNLVDLHTLAGRRDQLMSLARRAIAEAEDYGSPLFHEISYRALAQAQLALGQPAAAARLLHERLDLVAPGAIAFQFRAAHYLLLGEAERRLGRFPAAEGALDEGLQAALEARMAIWELRIRLRRAQLLLDLTQDCAAELALCATLLQSTACRIFEPEYLDLHALSLERAGAESAALRLRDQAHAARLDMGIRPGQAESTATQS